MEMHNPPHPGEIIRNICLESFGLGVTDAAAGLDVTRTLSAILNGPECLRRWLRDYQKRSAARPIIGSGCKIHTIFGNCGRRRKSLRVKKYSIAATAEHSQHITG